MITIFEIMFKKTFGIMFEKTFDIVEKTFDNAIEIMKI